MTSAPRGHWETHTETRALAICVKRRCLRCGKGDLFRNWFKMADACPSCGLRFERSDGYWLGSMALNLVVTEAIFVAALVALLVATWPAVPWTKVLVSVVALYVVVPLVSYPFSRTIWVAVERQASRAWD